MSKEKPPGDWQEVKKTITPLKPHFQRAMKKTAQIIEIPESLSRKEPTKKEEQSQKAIAPGAKKPVFLQKAVSLPRKGGGVDSNTARRLRRGKIRPEQRLDLHGMTRKKATELLEQTIRQAHNQELRCLLLITGKGSGVIRDMAQTFLEEEKKGGFVIDFCPAQPSDGGAGAFYVLIRRSREPK